MVSMPLPCASASTSMSTSFFQSASLRYAVMLAFASRTKPSAAIWSVAATNGADVAVVLK